MPFWDFDISNWADGYYLIIHRRPFISDIVPLTLLLTGWFAVIFFRHKDSNSWFQSGAIPASTIVQKWNILLCHFLTTAVWLYVMFWFMRGLFVAVESMADSMVDEVSREYGPGLSRGPFYAVMILVAYIGNIIGLALALYSPVGSSLFRRLLLERPLIIMSSDRPVNEIPWPYRGYLGYFIPLGILVLILWPVSKVYMPFGLLYAGPVILYMWSNWGLGHNLAKRELVRRCLWISFYWFFIYSLVKFISLFVH